jgi:hypothetical protein
MDRNETYPILRVISDPRRSLKELFPIHEEKAIKNGLGVLFENLKQMETNQFPKAVIFLDDSARPLFWAVKPIIDCVSAEWDLPKPTYHFLKHKTDFIEKIPFSISPTSQTLELIEQKKSNKTN